jgi:serine O-acetyltransferase
MGVLKTLLNRLLQRNRRLAFLYFMIVRKKLKYPIESFFSYWYYFSFKPVTCCEISYGIKHLGEKHTILPHPIGIVIGKRVVLGENCVVYQNVTIGGKSLTDLSSPVLGNNITVFANAIIVGDIKIGNNVTVGAGSVVTKNIPADCIVAGNPARVINKEKTQ